MNSTQRVARRYLKAKASLPTDFTLTSKTSSDSIKVQLKDRWINAGYVHANFETYSLEEIEGFNCADDMKALIERMPDELIDRDGLVRVVEVTLSGLEEQYKNKGFGVMMYSRIISEAFSENNRMPFLFIPNYCHRRSTSDEALRVWKSLARNFDNEGDVLAIRRKPS